MADDGDSIKTKVGTERIRVGAELTISQSLKRWSIGAAIPTTVVIDKSRRISRASRATGTDYRDRPQDYDTSRDKADPSRLRHRRGLYR